MTWLAIKFCTKRYNDTHTNVVHCHCILCSTWPCVRVLEGQTLEDVQQSLLCQGDTNEDMCIGSTVDSVASLQRALYKWTTLHHNFLLLKSPLFTLIVMLVYYRNNLRVRDNVPNMFTARRFHCRHTEFVLSVNYN